MRISFLFIVAIAILILTGSKVIDYIAVKRSTAIEKKEIAELNEPKFLACKEAAKAVNSKGSLGVCERQDHDDGIWYNSVPYTTTIIYDSTDEIQLESSHRSKEWKTVARSLDKKAPFGILGFRQVKKLGGHFYNVTFDAQYQPDF